MIDEDFAFECKANCDIAALSGEGDKVNQVFISNHPIAELRRKNAKSKWQATFLYYVGGLSLMNLFKKCFVLIKKGL
jgi:hypothetical protein